VFPTRYEGFGIVTTEAMAAGLAVVTTCTGAGADVVRDEKNGLLVPFGDVARTRDAVARLLDDDALRVRLARAGRIDAEAITWRSAGEALVVVYERAIANRLASR
jgi:glycosyltransferase involved in cell wall biosynthesis